MIVWLVSPSVSRPRLSVLPCHGGLIPNQNWYAPSLTSNREAGLGNWPLHEIADLLQVGTSRRGAVYGPMAEVVYNSLQYLTDEDARAMAVYLKSLPPRDSEPLPTSQARLVDPSVMELGRKIYAEQCAICHGEEGEGQAAHVQLTRDPIALDGFAATPEGWLRTDPGMTEGGMDGFFIARWKR